MGNEIRRVKKVMREFCVPKALVDSVDWKSLKTEIEIERVQRDLIETWFEIMELGENLI